MSILSIISILADGIADTSYAKKKMAAAYLAQEGTEYIRNMRDTFMFYDTSGPQVGWDAFLVKMDSCDMATVSSKGCYFNSDNLNYTNNAKPMTEITVNSCGLNCPPIFYDTTTGKYGYTGGVNSGFVRRIQMTKINGGANEVKISSTVSWTQGSGNYSMTFSENLFNWLE